MAPNIDTAKGFWLAFAGYSLWGIFPIYFYLVRHVSAPEVLAHRIIWSMVLLLCISYLFKSKVKWHQLVKSASTLVPCLFSSLFLSTNWLIFIWAIGNQMAIEGSLGYFINPLISVLMGMIFLGERLNKYQIIAISFAFIGVLFLIFKVGQFPWVALSLAITFAIYGLIHKKYGVDALAGLTLETIIAAPLAVLFMVYLFACEQNAFLAINHWTDSLLLMAGIVTSLPLLLFLSALPLLRLSTVGLLQFIVPTLHLLVAIYVLAEPFNQNKFFAFCIIWTGLLIFSFDTIRQRRLRNKSK